jgi:sec-independent protein translocase protein TatB
MFGLGMQEIIIILVVALLIIGPKKLPDLARSLGKALREFKGAADDFKQNLDIDPGALTPRSNIKTTHNHSTKETIETVTVKDDETVEEPDTVSSSETEAEAEAEMVTEDIKETKDQDTINKDK